MLSKKSLHPEECKGIRRRKKKRGKMIGKMIMQQVFFGHRKIYNPTNTGPQRENAALRTKDPVRALP